MKKIILLFIPLIIVVAFVFVFARTSVFNSINIFLLLPHFITLLFIKWIKQNIDSMWFLPLSFFISGLVLIIVPTVLKHIELLGVSTIFAIFYTTPFFIVTFICAIIKRIRNK